MSLGINITVRTLGGDLRKQVRANHDRMQTEVRAFLQAELRASQRRLERATPVRSGTMRASWEVGMRNDREGYVRNTAPYATFLFTGTRAHAIPRAFGFSLPFGTSPSFHPGTKKNVGLVKTMNDESRRIRDDYRQLGARLAITFWRQTLPGGEP